MRSSKHPAHILVTARTLIRQVKHTRLARMGIRTQGQALSVTLPPNVERPTGDGAREQRIHRIRNSWNPFLSSSLGHPHRHYHFHVRPIPLTDRTIDRVRIRVGLRATRAPIVPGSNEGYGGSRWLMQNVTEQVPVS